MTRRTHLAVRAGAILSALILPVLLLLPPDRSVEADRVPLAARPPAATPDLASLPPVFGLAGPQAPASDEMADRRPKLVGVAGRLPDDALALVRLPGEKMQTIRIGDTLMEWRLSALAADRATFVRGTERYDSVLDPVE